MTHPLTRDQQLENRAFLRALTRTGNVRLAARAVGVAYGTMQYRRARHPAFATRWDVALASAQARLNGKGARRPEARAAARERTGVAVTEVNSVTSDGSALPTAGRPAAGAFRTAGGEPLVIRLSSGKLQVRAAQPGKLTGACEQAFLLALSATANVRLSAAAAGAAEGAFYRRRRRNPGFAREWRAALAQGYERLEGALLEGATPESHADDAWQHNETPALPPMTTAQALQLLYLHQKEARLLAEPAHLKRRRGEPDEAHRYRLSAMYRAGIARDREAFRVREAARRAGDGLGPHERAVALPDLAQVKGWSRADPTARTHGPAALFGGWRTERLTPEQLDAAADGRALARPAPVVRPARPKRKPGRQLLPGTAKRGTRAERP